MKQKQPTTPTPDLEHRASTLSLLMHYEKIHTDSRFQVNFTENIGRLQVAYNYQPDFKDTPEDQDYSLTYKLFKKTVAKLQPFVAEKGISLKHDTSEDITTIYLKVCFKDKIEDNFELQSTFLRIMNEFFEPLAGRKGRMIYGSTKTPIKLI